MKDQNNKKHLLKVNITNILETWKSIHFITWDSKKYVLNKTPQISYWSTYALVLFVVLFVWLGFNVPLENFSLIWRRHHYRCTASIFDLYSAPMAIEQWGFYSVSHLLWQGASVNIYNVHLQKPLTLSSVAERLAVELSIIVFTTYAVATGIWTPNLLHAKRSL